MKDYTTMSLEELTKERNNMIGFDPEDEQDCLEAIKENPFVLQFIKNQTPEICLEAIKQDGDTLQYVEEQTEEICLLAIKQCGYALEYVKEQTPKICIEAVKDDIISLQYVKDLSMIINKKDEELNIIKAEDALKISNLNTKKESVILLTNYINEKINDASKNGYKSIMITYDMVSELGNDVKIIFKNTDKNGPSYIYNIFPKLKELGYRINLFIFGDELMKTIISWE